MACAQGEGRHSCGRRLGRRLNPIPHGKGPVIFRVSVCVDPAGSSLILITREPHDKRPERTDNGRETNQEKQPGMSQRFSEPARRALGLANRVAQLGGHSCLGTEHILFAMFKEGSGLGATALRELDVDIKSFEERFAGLATPGGDLSVAGEFSQSPQTRKAVAYAFEEARALNHNYVGTEHILLGLLRESEGIAAQVLMNLDVSFCSLVYPNAEPNIATTACRILSPFCLHRHPMRTNRGRRTRLSSTKNAISDIYRPESGFCVLLQKA